MFFFFAKKLKKGGYCTSGFVSNLAAYCANTCKKDRGLVDIENLFDGNLCRCTGFRPVSIYNNFCSVETIISKLT